MEYLFIYALQIVDVFKVAVGVCSLITLFAGIALIPVTIASDDIPDNCKKACKATFITCLTIVVLGSFLPTKQTLILWGGTYYGKAAVNHVVNTDKYKKISELIDLKLDSLIQDERNKK